MRVVCLRSAADGAGGGVTGRASARAGEGAGAGAGTRALAIAAVRVGAGVRVGGCAWDGVAISATPTSSIVAVASGSSTPPAGSVGFTTATWAAARSASGGA